ncbi:hypothetical protein DUI87_00974 [Hirundo rustica rustica]|uniref:Reverse transcriptase thumb domain-containing protein n=1 Tax=Hirundo rustica rustica TaxID=333673 RepID=A0A3M0L4Q5_HIRRU|nr:hypothetical protein DUI87_00942 [Hirundo rustica rustica]RMC20124.1 hypothetical protein DUI87_00970 [Hirundo rustica rustica]RMC20128.1 hypothetical protein DUI87_00974 [Hirundo rustica rustica]
MPKLILLERCPQPPFYLAKGQIITQAIHTPVGVPVDDKTPDVYWTEVVGEDKPIMGCNLTCRTDHLHEDKVQRVPPWKYLGLEITLQTVVPQKLELKSDPKTLADLHSLCGSLNWVRPWLGFISKDLDCSLAHETRRRRRIQDYHKATRADSSANPKSQVETA